MKNKITSISVIILIAVCIIFFAYVTYANSNVFEDIDKNIQVLSNKWTYSFTYNNNRTTIPVEVSDKEFIFYDIMAEKVHLQSKIERSIDSKDCNIILYSVHSSVYVKIDNKLIYSYDNNNKKHTISSPGNAYHFISIPSDYMNKDITIDLINSYPSRSMSFNNVLVSSKTDYVRYLTFKYFLPNITNVLIVSFGLFMLTISLMLMYRKYFFLSSFWLSLFSIFTGIWLISESRLTRVFINTAELQFIVCFLTLYLMPITFLMFIKTEYKPKKMAYVNGMLFCFEGFLIVALTLQAFKIKDLIELLPIFHFMVSTSLLIVFIIMTTEYINTKKKRLARFFYSSSLLLIFSLLAVINYYLRWNYSSTNFVQFGFIIFILTLFANTYSNLVDVIYMQKKTMNLEHLAYKDTLTGIRNRASYSETMARYNNILDSGIKIGLIMLDINNLKITNDELGHQYGDQLIKISSAIICSTFHKFDVFRIGGDEFVVLLKDIDLIEANQLCLKLDRAVKEHNTHSTIPVSIACGYAIYDPKRDKSLDDVFIRADKNMYSLKQSQKTNDA